MYQNLFSISDIEVGIKTQCNVVDMQEIRLNFRKLTGTRVGGGHRSSNGWVSCWTDFTEYKLTVDRDDVNLSLSECNHIRLFLSNYNNRYEDDQDWGVYMNDECFEENQNITTLLDILNKCQSKRRYVGTDGPQEYSIDSLLQKSLNLYNETIQLLSGIKKQELEAIAELKSYYNKLRLKEIYPNLVHLIIQEQISLNEKFMSTDLYPIDIVIANNDSEFLIKLILERNNNFKFSDINSLYSTIVTCSPSFYEQLINQNLTSLGQNEVIALYNFVTDIEEQYGKRTIEKNPFGNNQSKLLLKGGMLSLAGHILSQGKFKEWEIISETRKTYNKWNFFCPELVALMRVANLTFERWDKLNFDNHFYEEGDYRFFSSFLYGGIALFNGLLPFSELIIRNENLLKKLSIIYGYHSNDREPLDYLRDKFKSQIEKMKNLKMPIGPWC